MQNIALLCLYCLLVFCSGTLYAQTPLKIQGWNILSDSYEDALVTIAAAPEYHINHMQLSHDLVMDLSEMKEQAKRDIVNKLVPEADGLVLTFIETGARAEKQYSGQWKWRNDAKTAREYHQLITETGWKEYGSLVFNLWK